MGIAASRSGTTFLPANSSSHSNATLLSSIVSSSAASITSSVVNQTLPVSSLVIPSVPFSSAVNQTLPVSSLVSLSAELNPSSTLNQTLPVSSSVATASHALPFLPQSQLVTSAPLANTTSTQTSSIAQLTSSSTTMSSPISSSVITGKGGDDSVPPTGNSSSASVSSSDSSSSSVSSGSSSALVISSTASSSSPSTLSSSDSVRASSSSSEATSAPSSSDSSNSSQKNGSSTANNSPSSSQENAAQIVSTTSGQAKSTSVHVVTQTTPSSTMTSTITDTPQSTFSSPKDAVTIISDGKTTTSFPALVTVTSTSELSDGSFTTATHVIANPTDVVSGDTANAHSFFHNEGAVAGVFTVLGIVVAALAGCLFIICRRRRRRASRTRQWLTNIQKRLPVNVENDPQAFENPRNVPVMRSLSQNDHYYSFQSPSPNTARPFFDAGDEDVRSPAAGLPSNSLGLTSIEPLRVNPFIETLPPHQEEESPIGLAVTTNNYQAHQARASLAQSSPSIYPASTYQKKNEDDDVSVYDLMNQPAEDEARPQSSYSSDDAGLPTPISPGPFDDTYSVKPSDTNTLAPRALYPLPPPVIRLSSPVPSPPPSRPVRSALRETLSKSPDQSNILAALATPPESLTGHGHGSSDSEPEGNSPEILSELPNIGTVKGLENLFARPASSPPATAIPTTSSTTVAGSKNSNSILARRNSASKSIENIVMRRTLLDVRPRSSRDSVAQNNVSR